ncbi:DUF116 domain-containing protein [Candidatus Undinarchaeota archaeon]
MGIWDIISYYNIGRGVVLILAIILVLIIFALMMVLWMQKRNKLFFPKSILWLIYTLYIPVIFIGKSIGIDQDTIDTLCTEIRNKVDQPGFKKTKYKDRALFLPQCMRAPKCPATLTKNGIVCKHCGLCSIDPIKKKAEKLGYKVFVVPGGSFVERIIKRLKPHGIFGVACPKEVQMAEMSIHKKGLFFHAVPLSKAGCVNTEVDEDRVLDELE